MGKKVAILGGGVAGMSAAHELIERGFEVSVYEAKAIPGGKARSMPVPGSGRDGREDLPGEHGFRFFPGFYRHVTDTMKRIPYADNPLGVFDNLVQATRTGLVRFDEPMVILLARFPKSISDIKTLIKSLCDNDLGLSASDAEYAFLKIWQVMTSCEERRLQEYQQISWWDFVSARERSKAFQQIFTGITQFAVAVKATKANTRTIGDVAGQLLYDMVVPGSSGNDHVLNGPTNRVWIEPWLEYLRSQGVDYHLETNVTSIECERGMITGATAVECGRTFQVQADYYIAAFPVEVMAELISDDMLEADPALANIKKLSKYVEWMSGIQFYLKKDIDVVNGHVVYIDSPWALTSISQQQFWPDIDLSRYGNGQVKGILSVDISDWTSPGILYGKPAMQCTREEIKNEVWAQVKKSLNAAGPDLLHDDDIVEWFLDPSIYFVNPHESVNLEPLLVNEVGTWELRPESFTRIPNLFLAADYVRTNTDFASMEGANEAARRAVNAIIDASGSCEQKCEIWEMYEPGLLALWRAHDRKRFNEGLPWDGNIFSLIGGRGNE